MKDIPDADILIVPVGGGGLISGIAMAAKAINPQSHGNRRAVIEL